MNLKHIKDTQTVSVAAFVFTKIDGVWNILVSRRGATAPSGAGLYNVPMGHIDGEETSVQAAHREVLEETSIDIPEDKFTVLPFAYFRHSKGANVAAIIDYAEPTDGDGECEDTHWHPVTKIGELDWAFNLNKSINKFAPQVITDSIILDTLISGKCKIGNLNDEFNMMNRCCPNLSEDVRNHMLQLLHTQFANDTELQYELSTAVRPDVKFTMPVGKMALLFY